MPTRLKEIGALVRGLESEPAHVGQVCNIALKIFDQTRDLHKLGRQERQILQAAALLHDIGHSRTKDGRKHHKWSAKLIREHTWTTLESAEIHMIACTARYHRRALPSLRHAEFSSMSSMERRIVQKLSAILRVADGLDHSHRHGVRGLKVRRHNGRVILAIESRKDISIDVAAAIKKADLFESVFGCELEVQTE